MMLSDAGLRAALQAGGLTIDPYEADLVQPASVDVRLHRWFRVFHGFEPLDPALHDTCRTTLVEVPAGEAFILGPREFALASTLERITVGPRHAARVEGKSGLGRLGLRIHSTAGFIDPGFHGHVTLELSNDNHRPIVLHPGMPVGQLCVFRLDGPAATPYGSTAAGSHYQGQEGPTESRTWDGWRTWPTGLDTAAGPGHR